MREVKHVILSLVTHLFTSKETFDVEIKSMVLPVDRIPSATASLSVINKLPHFEMDVHMCASYSDQPCNKRTSARRVCASLSIPMYYNFTLGD